ncbi:hypothetical protein H0G86_012869 [Trichoderma simmonsii]|uniref:Uncharacterized protein n=1 Tax=Trichoderma simmonsii TaxID=1491479 RepID=A0A8G0LS70_9HYPO|nr:hypothetical protein H0G86_012869 [Trichoderma simmonsii]
MACKRTSMQMQTRCGAHQANVMHAATHHVWSAVSCMCMYIKTPLCKCSAVPLQEWEKNSPSKETPPKTPPARLKPTNHVLVILARLSSSYRPRLFCIEIPIKTSKRSANPFKANESIAAPFG